MPTVAEFYGTSHWGDLFGATEDRPNPHRGMDFNGWGTGTQIPALYGGTVVFNDAGTALGNMVSIQRSDGIIFGYSHLNAPSPLGVGQSIAQGQSVGPIGNTGTASFGTHLHLTRHTSGVNPGSATVTDPAPDVTAAINGSGSGGGGGGGGGGDEPPPGPVEPEPSPYYHTFKGWYDGTRRAAVTFTPTTGRMSVRASANIGLAIMGFSISNYVSREGSIAGFNFNEAGFAQNNGFVTVSKEWVFDDFEKGVEKTFQLEFYSWGGPSQPDWSVIYGSKIVAQNLISNDVLPDLRALSDIPPRP